MPDNQSGNNDTRAISRSGRSDTSWVIVAIAVIAGSLLGFVFRPAIVNLANGQTTGGNSGLTDAQQNQVDGSITRALTPVSTTLDEIKAALNPQDEETADAGSNAERISSELNMFADDDE